MRTGSLDSPPAQTLWTPTARGSSSGCSPVRSTEIDRGIQPDQTPPHVLRNPVAAQFSWVDRGGRAPYRADMAAIRSLTPLSALLLVGATFVSSATSAYAIVVQSAARDYSAGSSLYRTYSLLTTDTYKAETITGPMSGPGYAGWIRSQARMMRVNQATPCATGILRTNASSGSPAISEVVARCGPGQQHYSQGISSAWSGTAWISRYSYATPSQVL